MSLIKETANSTNRAVRKRRLLFLACVQVSLTVRPSLARGCERSNTQYRPLTWPDAPMQKNAAFPSRGQGSGAQKRKAALGGTILERGMRTVQRVKDDVYDTMSDALQYIPKGTREERKQKREQQKALEEFHNPSPSGSGACARAHHLASRVCVQPCLYR